MQTFPPVVSNPPEDADAFDAWARGTMFELATAAVRLAPLPVGSPNAEMYRELVAANETEQAAFGMTHASGCGLVVRGLWRLAGLKDARLEAPYRVGKVLEQLQAMAHEAGAWMPASSYVDTDDGDVMWLGTMPTNPSEHVATVVGVYKGMGIQSIDGGQAGGAILRRSRAISKDGLTLTGFVAEGRKIEGFVNWPLVARRFHPRAPR